MNNHTIVHVSYFNVAIIMLLRMPEWLLKMLPLKIKAQNYIYNDQL